VPTLGAEVVADILDHLADAHMRLAEGQGAELLWRDARDKRVAPLDALKIYALKTAPAFGAALYAGARLAGDAKPYAEALAQFAKHLGVAFQILNDLDDWELDSHNKLAAGGDVLGGRPTVLWALALESLDEAHRAQLESLAGKESTSTTLAQVRDFYRKAGVFEKAQRLVDKYRERAEALADAIEPEELRRLLYYLVDTVLEQTVAEPPAVEVTGIADSLPIVTPS
jgi:geranylgeranyl pyrophosphate synthase